MTNVKYYLEEVNKLVDEKQALIKDIKRELI